MEKNGSSIISLRNLTKEYNGTVVVDDINLDIKRGEFVTLLGPSGCGKTTTLRMIAGFESPTSGEVLFGGENIADLPPHKRNVNTVFQRYALFPHLNVEGNVAFGLKLKRIPVEYTDKKGRVRTKDTKMPKTEIEAKITRALKVVGLQGYEQRAVNTLSGGQQQRVAIARAIVNEPEILLLDEPLGALDLKMRQEMQLELKQMHKNLGITFIYVTHDQEEALTMSDTIVVMRAGVVYQVGSPTDIYNEPKNAFVADFIGESNIFDGVTVGHKKVSFCGAAWPCVDEGFESKRPVDVVIRPEDWVVTAAGKGQVNGEISSCIFKGVHYEMTLKANGFEFLIHNTKKFAAGEKAGLTVDPFDIHVMEKEQTRNVLEAEFADNETLVIAGAEFAYDHTALFPGSSVSAESGLLVLGDGAAIDIAGKKANVAVDFTGIEIIDHEEDAPLAGNITSMVYKGKNYLVTILTDDDSEIIADTEFLWDNADRIGIKISPQSFRFLNFGDGDNINEQDKDT